MRADGVHLRSNFSPRRRCRGASTVVVATAGSRRSSPMFVPRAAWIATNVRRICERSETSACDASGWLYSPGVPAISGQLPSVVASGRAVVDMTTAELLHVLLLGGPTTSAIETAAALIDAGDCAVRPGHSEDLRMLTGVGLDDGRRLAAALELGRRAAGPAFPPVLRSPVDVAAIAQRELGGRRRERLLAIVCDAANRPIRNVAIADGALDRCPFPIREILHAVLRFDGRAFALAHNHFGSAEPSDADIDVTATVAGAACVVGLRFLGHVIVGAHEWRSVRVERRELTIERRRQQ